MSAHLVACPSCARHVRVSEQACPFCRTSLPASFAAAPGPRTVGVRLKRAALYAIGGTLTVACGGGLAQPMPGPQDGAPGFDAGDDGADGYTGAPMYGAPAYGIAPLPEAGDDDVDSSIGPLYGGPCPGGGCWQDAAPGDAGPDVAVGDAAPADATPDAMKADACVAWGYALYGGPPTCLDEGDQ